MDRHQSEVADELSRQGYLYSCSPAYADLTPALVALASLYMSLQKLGSHNPNNGHIIFATIPIFRWISVPAINGRRDGVHLIGQQAWPGQNQHTLPFGPQPVYLKRCKLGVDLALFKEFAKFSI